MTTELSKKAKEITIATVEVDAYKAAHRNELNHKSGIIKKSIPDEYSDKTKVSKKRTNIMS